MISAKTEIENHIPLKFLRCFLLSLLLRVALGKACEVDMCRQSLAAPETLLFNWEDCQDHPWVPASVSRALKSLSIIGVRSVSILHAHMDGNHGTRVSEPSVPLQMCSIWPASGPLRCFSSRSRLLQPIMPPVLAPLRGNISFSEEASYWGDSEEKKKNFCISNRISLMAQQVKNQPAMQKT